MENSENSFESYFSRFCRRLNQDASAWARDNILWAALMVVAPPVAVWLRYGTYPDWKTIEITLWLYALIFLAYLVAHSVRTPWKLDQQRQSEFDKVKSELTEESKSKQTRIDALEWPADRPQISFERWGALEEGGIARTQRGFHLVNHGSTAALDVSVEGLSVGSAKWVSKPVPIIEQRQKGFAFFWEEGSQHNFTKWDLLEAISKEVNSSPVSIHAPDPTFDVSVTYRSFDNAHYRTRCTLTFIRSQRMLSLGAPKQEKVKS